MLHALKNRTFNLFTALAVVTIFTTLQSSSCSKDDATGTDPGNITGSWKVSLYWDNSDETYKFSGYNFVFNSGGTVTATKAGLTVNGTWSESSTKFILNFGTDPVFKDLNDDWLKVEKTAVAIKLKEDNPLKNHKLEFVKN